MKTPKITRGKKSKSTIFDVPEGDYRGTLCGAKVIPDKKAEDDCAKLLRLVFELKSPDHPGQRYVASQRYEYSFEKGSRLRLDLESLRGHDLTAREIDAGAIDLKGLAGRPADVVVEHYHNPKYAKPFVFINAIHPPGTLVRDAAVGGGGGGGMDGPVEKAESWKNDDVNRVGVDHQAGEEDDAPSWL